MVNSLPWKSSYSYSGRSGSPVEGPVDAPIVFIHGNSRDATDWTKHFEYFMENGIDGDRLWAISFDNSSLTHKRLAEQLEDFISNLLELTETNSISIVSHSLGVTVSRYWMENYDRYGVVSTFVGIAGANHGLDVCGPYTMFDNIPEGRRSKPCQVLGSSLLQKPPIQELNEKTGETPGDIDYYTIRGTHDSFYTVSPDSPRLEGAENIILETDHEGVREDVEALELIYKWTAT